MGGLFGREHQKGLNIKFEHLLVQLDLKKKNIYIYIYIYECVCVCVCIKYIAMSPKNCHIIVLLATQAIKLTTSSRKTNRAYFFKLQELITLI